jgi:ABC-type nitrate/sulfonate/bicarbonate transport system ATPase subunit
MVICGKRNQGSPEEARLDRTVTKQLNSLNDAESSVVKLLLLGAGGCGKSTIFKQVTSPNFLTSTLFQDTVTHRHAVFSALTHADPG